MSAIVCGKRSNCFFDDLQTTSSSSPSSSSPPLSKRLRCSSSFSPPRSAAASTCGGNLFSGISPISSPSSSAKLDHLVALFPDMDKQFLKRALDERGDDLDSTIRSLNELRLESATNLESSGKIEIAPQVDLQFTGAVKANGSAASVEDPSATKNLPLDGGQWVDLFVREMMSASNIDDAKARASQALDVLEKSICARAHAEAAQSFQEENVLLKQQLETLIQENNILKRAVSIQHERQKEFEDRGQELHQLKQLVSQYQEQLRTLEVNNYALTMHLKQAQQSNSIPGRFNPDVY